MRFTEDGPSIPDALLQARDEGRVIFFCGAGVSRARAGLPDFFGLAEFVIRELRVPFDSDACKVLRKAKEHAEELDVTGLISADRVFAFLEREFTSADIQSAVAKALAPPPNVDRSAHEVLLRLARSSDGTSRIITTNFDRLFEDESNCIRSFQPPRLPDLSDYDSMGGVVYLHGRANLDYTAADGDGFVVSSSDFGHAYLSEGWATAFFREIVRTYIVVFVGYSADDPPVHYLLEGLRRRADSLNRIYAFQDDSSDELIARWQHKGVEAIPYSSTARHGALWETLEHWAIRADDTPAWRKSILDRAMLGPRSLRPHERGQVSHIVSTYDGAKAFADAAPPAEWLCVFDPLCRFEVRERAHPMDPDHPIVDPFSLYGLDTDAVRQRKEDDFRSGTRDVPAGAWDAFALNVTDLQESSPDNYAAVRGHRTSYVPRLPKRLVFLGKWIGKVANQPAAVWWAARQESLHPIWRQYVETMISASDADIDGELLKAWQYRLESWNSVPAESRSDWYDLKKDLDRKGWSSRAVRRFNDLTTPRLTVGPAVMSRPVPLLTFSAGRVSDVLRVDVECPVPPLDAEIPDEWLPQVVRGLRQNIETAVRICEEVGDAQQFHISPLARDDRPGVDNFQRSCGLSGCVVAFSTLFERLMGHDLKRAREEFFAWRTDDSTAFARLRLWASGKPQITTPRAFAQIVRGLGDDVFWDSYHQRDLLIVLATRWGGLSDRDRRQIETRLLNGPPQLKGQDDASYREHRAWSVLQRLQWLTTQGCEFFNDVENEIVRRRCDAPKWKPEFAVRAADSRESRSVRVTTDTDFSLLLRVPISELLSKASTLSGMSVTSSVRELAPFAGLCAERPKRAYLALAHSARKKEFPEWAWTSFLYSPARAEDESCFSATIAARLCRLPESVLARLLYTATNWIQTVGKVMSRDYPRSFDYTVQRLIDVVQNDPTIASPDVHVSAGARDRASEALNSPIGRVVAAILEDERIDPDRPTSLTPCLERVGQCLALSGEPRRHAIVLASLHLDWIYQKQPEWAERQLLSILDGNDDDDRDSFWAGFFWNPQISSPQLFRRMKNGFLNHAKQGSCFRSAHMEDLAREILQGWISCDESNDSRWISDAEFNDALLHGGDAFRVPVLWQFNRALRSTTPADREYWQSTACIFFKNVWPRQKSVKNSTMTARLCELLLSQCETFNALFDVVRPTLTKITDATSLHLHLRLEDDDIVSTYSERIIDLLHTILPDDVRSWPYGIGDVFDKIIESNASLAKDPRLIDLRRKWNAQ